MSSSKTIALIDGFEGGHHETHLRGYAKLLVEMGHRVIELLPNPEPVKLWLADNGIGLQDVISLHPYKEIRPMSPSYRLRRWYVPAAMWRQAGMAVKQAEAQTGWHPDLVFFNWLDDYVLDGSRLVRGMLPALFPYRWSGVFFHPWHLRAPGGKADAVYQKSENMLTSRRCPAVAVLDAGVAAEMQTRIGKPVIAFPDETDAALPENDTPLVRQIHEAARGRKIIGLVGNLTRRKGIVSLLRAAEQATEEDWLFILVGEYGEGHRKTLFPEELTYVDRSLAAAASNVFFHGERIVDEAHFNAVVQTCDVLFAAYETFGHSSGIVTKAAVFEKPIVVSPGFCMAEVVDKYRMGVAVDPHDTDAVIHALGILLDRHAFRQHVGEPDFKGCRKAHSMEALKPRRKQTYR